MLVIRNNEYIDLLEKAFSDGYELGQREFGGRQEYKGLTKKGREELRNARGSIAQFLNLARKQNNLQQEFGKTTNNVLSAIGKNTTTRVKRVAPETKKSINKFQEGLKDVDSKVSDKLQETRNKKHEKALKASEMASRAARKFIGAKDKVRKRLQIAAEVF